MLSNRITEKNIGTILDDLKKNNLYHFYKSINEKKPLGEAIEIINSNSFGLVATTNEFEEISGVISDGDIRRVLLKSQGYMQGLLSQSCSNFNNKNPIYIKTSESLKNFNHKIINHKILSLPVINEEKKYLGILNISQLTNLLVFEK